jgi:glycyl-tRNA synthetase alpha subunit
MAKDYLFRLRMHEVESLIRLNRLDDAYKVCEKVFSTKDREKNNYCDLFFNTSYYHAAIIKYRQNDHAAAHNYFKDFFRRMRSLCKNILPKETYDTLVKSNSFEENPHKISIFLENSLKVFEAIYWKNYEFTKYYVEENIKLATGKASNASI